DTVALAGEPALENGTFDNAGDIVQRELRLFELLRNDRDGSAGGLADAKGEVAGLAPHDDDDEPAVCGAGVLHDREHDVGAGVAGGLIAESGHAGGEGEVVVDGLWDMGDANTAGGLAGDGGGAEGRVVAADGDEVG